MSTPILEIDNDLDVSKVLELLKPLNVRVKEENETAKRLELLKQGAGTINVSWNLTDEDLKRENFYPDIAI